MARFQEKLETYDIRRTQLIELDILIEFDRVCKKNSLSYFLDSGTAIGAVRHGGFIPWDDDIDVAMFREDYDKFINYAYKDLKDGYFLQTLATDPGCPCLFAKIRRNGTCYLENNKTGMKMHTGIWIDIFPFDGINDDKKEQLKISRRITVLINAFNLKKIPHKLLNNGQNPIKYIFFSFLRKIIHIMLQPISDTFFTLRINRIIEDNKNYDRYVTCYYYIMYKDMDNPVIFERERLLPLSEIQFEGQIFKVVKDIDYYLRNLYGDYMILPPEEKRVGHRPLFVDFGEDDPIANSV